MGPLWGSAGTCEVWRPCWGVEVPPAAGSGAPPAQLSSVLGRDSFTLDLVEGWPGWSWRSFPTLGIRWLSLTKSWDGTNQQWTEFHSHLDFGDIIFCTWGLARTGSLPGRQSTQSESPMVWQGGAGANPQTIPEQTTFLCTFLLSHICPFVNQQWKPKFQKRNSLLKLDLSWWNVLVALMLFEASLKDGREVFPAEFRSRLQIKSHFKVLRSCLGLGGIWICPWQLSRQFGEFRARNWHRFQRVFFHTSPGPWCWCHPLVHYLRVCKNSPEEGLSWNLRDHFQVF